MPLTTLPDQGIEVPLSEYNRLRAFQGGGWFWDHDNQQVIREVLGDFLPRVEERRDRGGALFQHFIGATETASHSQAVGTQMNRVPRAEYQRLQRALEDLKRKAQNPGTDPNARKVIEKFCLPDPAKDPELYRLYGSGWNRRLLVLWGCEREEGTSLAPTAALSKIAVESPATTLFRRLPVYLGWLLLLLLLIAAGVWWWQHRPAQETRHVAGSTDQPVVEVTDSGNQMQPMTKADAANSPTETAPVTANDTAATGRQEATGQAAKASKQTDSGQRSSDARSEESASDVARTARTDSAISRDSSTAGDTRSSTQDANAGKSATDQSRTDRSDASTREQATSSAAKSSDADKATDRQQATAGQRTTETRNTDTAAASPSALTPENRAAASAGNSGANMASPGVGSGLPPKLEILKAESSSTPHDGKLDVVLMATAHEGDNGSAPLEIMRWTVDDVPQQDRTGHDITTGQLRLALPAGKHHVGVSATVRGTRIETDTDMDVQIKSQGDVTLKPRGAR